MNARIPTLYTGPTANPAGDAERHENDREDADEWSQEAARQAPDIMFRRLQTIYKPAAWFDQRKFLGRYSAEEILRDALGDADDEVTSAYAEFMADTTSAAKEKLHQAMADCFCKTWAVEVYTEYLEDLQ